MLHFLLCIECNIVMVDDKEEKTEMQDGIDKQGL